MDIFTKLLLFKKQLLLVSFTVFIFSYSVTLFLPTYYQSSTKLYPSGEQSRSSISSESQLLTSLTGMSKTDPKVMRYFSILNSRDFIYDFLKKFSYLEFFLDGNNFYSDLENLNLREEARVKDFVVRFYKNHFRSTYDIDTGEVTFYFIWTDPLFAGTFLTNLSSFFNERIASLDIIQSKNNLNYLNEYYKNIAVKDNIEVMKSVSALLSYETKKIMLANTTANYAFEIIDTPSISYDRYKPSRLFIAASCTVIALFFTSFYLLFLRTFLPFRQKKSKNN